MNINSYSNSNNSFNVVTTENRNKVTSLKLKNSQDEQVVSDKIGFAPQGNAIVETNNRDFYSSPNEVFNIVNRNSAWLVDGEEVNFKDLDEESKNLLSEFTNIHTNYVKEKQNDSNFGDLIVQLGNAYASKREEYTEKYSGDELNEKLSKLEKTFKMYTETKVVGNVNEVGSMANSAYFNLAEAKTDRMIKERLEAFQSGKDVTKVKNRDITSDDKQTLSKLLKDAKSALDNVTAFFNKNGVVSGNHIEKLYNYTREDGTWSLGKLNMTFELLENTKVSNPDRYSKTEFNEVMNSEEANRFLTDDEKSFFEEIFNCYN